MLAIKPEEINMRRVIETIDGPVEISRCLDNMYECTRIGDRRHECVFHLIFAKLNKTIADKMDTITLASLIDDNMDIEKILSNL